MPNRLVNETSPYLKQHAENPVDWYAWNEEAFHAAREQDKPIHLSVGYAACHWCHVMAHESFENPEIASLLNEYFINIKVDRQERPDIDEIYQKFIQMTGQTGGWPLTVFMTPEGEPFFGGTYFPPESRYGRPGFPEILLAVQETWQKRRQELYLGIKEYLKGFQILDERLLEGNVPKENDMPVKAAVFLASNMDLEYGGFAGAPKFPNPVHLDLILRIYCRTKDPLLLKALKSTLDKMSVGGIYDQLGGGFSRYSVDEKWSVPHFEKMLYDNGQLVKLYADAYRMTGNKEWKRIFEETVTYILRDMTHPNGGFYASEDADSEGEEGKFYVWTPREIVKVLGSTDGEFACRVLGVTKQGNFEHHTTVLHKAISMAPIEEEHYQRIRYQLLAVRNQRIRPHRDENIITAWNALMIQGLCAAYQAAGNCEYLFAAKKAAEFIESELTMRDGGIYRIWKDGTAKIPGFLDDYAFLANALIDLYESCFEKKFLERSKKIVDLIFSKFWDDGLYFTAKEGETLVNRPKSAYDNVYPSGISASVFAFLRLYELTGLDFYYSRATYLLNIYTAASVKNPFSFSHLLAAQDFLQNNPIEIIFSGTKNVTDQLIELVHRTYIPAKVLAFAEDVPIGEGRLPVNGQTTVYICRNRTCEAPITDLKTLIKNLNPN